MEYSSGILFDEVPLFAAQIVWWPWFEHHVARLHAGVRHRFGQSEQLPESASLETREEPNQRAQLLYFMISRLGKLASSKGNDILLTSGTEAVQSFDRLRARLALEMQYWTWRPAGSSQSTTITVGFNRNQMESAKAAAKK